MPLATYILDDDGKPVLEKDIVLWAEWFERIENRVIWRDDLPHDIRVSTVFLGIDHNHLGRGPPILWETMIFGGSEDGYQRRYTSSGDAYAGHEAAFLLAGGVRDTAPED